MKFRPDVVIPQLCAIQKGQQVVYYRGNLAEAVADAEDGPNEIREIQIVARKLRDEGRLHLVQRRLGPPQRFDWSTGHGIAILDWCRGTGPGFEYIAIGA